MTPPIDLAELQRLLPLISPLPYWIEPAQPTLKHGYHRTLDAYIACGTQGDSSDTFDVIERYEVDTDYAYLVAAANAVPALLSELTALREREQVYLELLGRIAAGMREYDGAVYTFGDDVVRRLCEIDAMLASSATEDKSNG